MITQLVRSRPGDPSPHALTGDMGGHVRSAGLGNVKEGLEESTCASFDKQKSPLWTVAVVINQGTDRPAASSAETLGRGGGFRLSGAVRVASPYLQPPPSRHVIPELGTCGSGRVAAPGLPRADFLTSCRVLLRRAVGAAGRRGRRAGAWASRSFPGPACAVPAQSASPPRARLSHGTFPHFHPLKAASNKNELSPRQS